MTTMADDDGGATIGEFIDGMDAGDVRHWDGWTITLIGYIPVPEP